MPPPDLQPDAWISRRQTPCVRLDVPGLLSKEVQSPPTQKSLTQEMIQERYPSHSWTQAYTDGSAQQAIRNGDSGALIKFPDGTPATLSLAVGKKSSNYRAEVEALAAAVDHLQQENVRQQNIVFLSDCLSALQALSSGPSDNSSRHLQETLHALSQHNNVTLQWIPAHVGVLGNETADRLAKEGSRLPQPQPLTTYKEAKTLLKRNFAEDWIKQNDGYNP